MRRMERSSVQKSGYIVYLLQLEAPDVCLTSPAASSPSEDMLGADLIKKRKIYKNMFYPFLHGIFKNLPTFLSG